MKRIVQTKRDLEIIEFLKKYRCATTSTISSIFFKGSRRPTTRRLQYLREHGFINSSQEYVSIERVHYIGKKPTQLKHSCITSKVIAKLHEQDAEILKSKIEYKIGNVRADMLLVLKIRNKPYIYFVEVCNTKKFDLNKYKKLYESMTWKKVFPVFPSILVLSDKEVDTYNKFDMKVFNLNLDNFEL